jgi:hypothetical protein
MDTAEILAELPRLTAVELAKVQAKSSEPVPAPVGSAKRAARGPAHVRTPRLAHVEQSGDFVKQVVE